MAKKRKQSAYLGFKRLEELDETQQVRVEQLLIMGEPARSVAELMQNEWGLFKDVQVMTLARQLDRYRSKHLLTKIVRTAEKVPESRIVELQVRHEHQLDVLGKLTALAELQERRVCKAHEREATTPLLFNWLGQEIRTLKDLYAQIAEVQMEVGIVARAPKKLDARFNFNENATKIHELQAEFRKFDKMTLVTEAALKEIGYNA